MFTQAIDKFAARMTEVTLAIEPEEASEPAVDQGPMVRLKNFDQNASAADTAGLSLLQESINTESDIPHSQFETIRVSAETFVGRRVREVAASAACACTYVFFDSLLVYCLFVVCSSPTPVRAWS